MRTKKICLQFLITVSCMVAAIYSSLISFAFAYEESLGHDSNSENYTESESFSESNISYYAEYEADFYASGSASSESNDSSGGSSSGTAIMEESSAAEEPVETPDSFCRFQCEYRPFPTTRWAYHGARDCEDCNAARPTESGCTLGNILKTECPVVEHSEMQPEEVQEEEPETSEGEHAIQCIDLNSQPICNRTPGCIWKVIFEMNSGGEYVGIVEECGDYFPGNVA